MKIGGGGDGKAKAWMSAELSPDTNPAVCEVTARKKGVVKKPHASRHLATSVRIFLNNLARGRQSLRQGLSMRAIRNVGIVEPALCCTVEGTLISRVF